MRRVGCIDAALLIWAGLGVAAAGADVWLIRTDRRLLSQAARTPGGRLIQGVLVLHFANRLGRFDPFQAAFRYLTRPPEVSCLPTARPSLLS